MMRATGKLYLAKAAPVFTEPDGCTPTLTLLAFDRIGPHQVEPWRITHSGLGALMFWSVYQADLVPGAPICVELERIRCFSTPRGPEFHATATRIAVGDRLPDFQTNQTGQACQPSPSH